MSFIIGIDPGLTGAVVVMTEAHEIDSIYDMPVTKLSSSSKKNQVDAAALAKILEIYHYSCVFIERVGAMPSKGKPGEADRTMGSASAYNFGYGAGILHGVVAAMKMEVNLVMPAVWKRHHGLLKTEKDAARLYAIEKFPAAADALKRKKDSGRADALLIADYGVNQVRSHK